MTGGIKRRRYWRLIAVVVTAITCLLPVMLKNHTDDNHVLTKWLEHELPTAAVQQPPCSGDEFPLQQCRHFREAIVATTSPAPQFDELVQVLAARADADRYVMLAMTDEAFLDMAINFYEASLRAHHIDNFVFIGIGRKTCETLTNMSIPCFHYADDPSAGKASSYGQREFKRKMNLRTEMILEALAANFTVIHSDTDIAFLGNPLNQIKVATKSLDVAPMWDSSCYNAGFIVIRPTTLGKQLYLIIRQMTNASKIDDQASLNKALKELRVRNSSFRMQALNTRSFLCGRDYFERSGRLLPNANDCNPLRTPNCPLVVHNNWIVSRSAKIYRFRDHLLWMYDGSDQYYSSRTRNYLTYTNPRSPNATSDRQVAALTTALAIGRLLNRVVVLPTFLCKKMTECPLNSLIRISRLDSCFKDQFRESSFLRHPKVPGDVKRKLYDVARSLRRDNAVNIRVTSRKLLQLFANLTARVLNFGILFGVEIVFDNEAEGEVFNEMVLKCIRRAGYRQY